MSDLDPNAFTVKEMILQVMTKLDKLDEKLDDKAPASEVASQGLRITALEHAQISRKAVWVVSAGIAALVPVATLAMKLLIG